MSRDNIHPQIRSLAVPIDTLSHYGKNPRRGNVKVIAESLRVNGQYKPITARAGTNEVLVGNHTLAAAREEGWTHIAVTFVDVDDEKAAKIVVIDNRSSDIASNADDVLAELLDSMQDLDGTGYDEDDLAHLIGGLLEEPEGDTDPDDVPEAPVKQITLDGDVWKLGDHVLVHGDGTDSSVVYDAVAGRPVDCVWTDPPAAHEAVVERTDGDPFAVLLAAAFKTMQLASRSGAPVYVCHSEDERVVVEEAMRSAGLVVRQHLVWVKPAPRGDRSDYPREHEPITLADGPGGEDTAEAMQEHEPIAYAFTPGGHGKLGKGGKRWFGAKRQGTVIYAPPANADEQIKPVALVRAMLSNSLPPRGLVLDPFAGFGTTLIAAHHEGGRAVLIEKDPARVDIICRRWQEHTGITPTRASTGEPVSFTAGID